MRFQLKIETDYKFHSFWMSEIIATGSKLWRTAINAAKDAGQERVFNDHCVNIVEKTSGKKPSNLPEIVGCEGDGEIV